MVVVDTSVFIEYFRGINSNAAKQLDEILQSRIVILGDIVALELLQGVRSKKEEKLLKDSFQHLEKKHMLDFELADQYAQMYRLLRAKGNTIRKSNDVIIAGFCIKNDYPLLQKDRDFQPFAEHLGLRLI